MIKLGVKARDRISGIVGIIVSKTEYLNGCVQYGVQPKPKKGTTEIVIWSIDSEQLELVDKNPLKIDNKPKGGPTRRAHTYGTRKI